MNKKKVFEIICILIAIAIAVFCVTKIFAEEIRLELGEEWESTGWGRYEITEDGEIIFSEQGYESKNGTYTMSQSINDIANKVHTDGIYYDELKSDGSIFCIQKGTQLPSRDDENVIRQMGSGGTLGDQYYNGSVILTGLTTSKLSRDEQNALQVTSTKTDAHTSRRGYNGYPLTAQFYSRSLKDQNGRISGTITRMATKNDGTIKWSDGTTATGLAGAEIIPWADAYVLAKSDPTAAEEENPAQLALWKLMGLNQGKSDVAENDLYKEAKLFGEYKKAQEENGDGAKIFSDDTYTYKFVEQGSYLIAGPITMNYGDLTLKDGSVELDVKQIANFKVYGATYGSNHELRDITEYVTFTDANGNELADMEAFNELDDDGNETGTIQSFPKNDTEFYIKVDKYNDFYREIESIVGFEVSFKELNARAVAAKVSDVKVHYTKWIPNNILWVKCMLTHNYTTRQRQFTGFDATGNPQYRYVNVPATTTATEGNSHLKNYSSVTHYCDQGHSGCTVSPSNGTASRYEVDTGKSQGILIKGDTNSETTAQILLLLNKAELYWRKYKVVILFGPDTPNTPPSETPTPTTGTPDTHKTYIDIGGKVWVDDVESKAGDKDIDGIYGVGNDYPRPNVKVTLYFDNGDKVQKSDTAPDGKFENDVYTDPDGNYMFYDLPIDKKYYVEFTYDGMMYETTTFLAPDGDVDAYMNNPNDSKYDNNSKAKEQDSDRQAFNDKFEEIKGNGTYGTTGSTKGGITLEYLSKKFPESTLPQSRLRTTDNEQDVMQNHATGKAKTDFEMKVDTRKSGIIYPFIKDGEIVIWKVNGEPTDQVQYLQHINLGLKRRETADLRIAVDIKAGATTIKEKEKVVFYNPYVLEEKLASKDGLVENVNGTVDDVVKDEVVRQMTEGKTVEQSISASDYYWETNAEAIYGAEKANTAFTLVKDHLNVYVMYKIMLANQSDSTDTTAVVTGLVDYFDSALIGITDQKEKERVSKIFTVGNAFNVPEGLGDYMSWIEGTTTKVNWTKTGNVGNYTKIETTDSIELGGSGETKTIYLILKVDNKQNEKILYTGTEGNKNGMENIAEIASYKILKNGNAAGLVDKDSAPYNAQPGKPETYEDDTGVAPMFKIELNWEPREISGNVWEDINKDAINNETNTGINNVKVELLEYVVNKDSGEVTDVIVRPGLKIDGNTIKLESNGIRTQSDGSYKFYVEGGNYAIRFTYGDKVMLADPNSKHYNAQDYRASKPSNYENDKMYYYALSSDKLKEAYKQTYSMAFATKAELQTYLSDYNNRKLSMDLSISDYKTQQEYENNVYGLTMDNKYSNGKEYADIRSKIIQNTVELTNTEATLLHNLNPDGKAISAEDITKLTGNDNDGNSKNYTYMVCESDIIVISSNDIVKTNKIVNLGLSEREKASLKLEKIVKRIVLKTNDGTVLIDTADASKQSNLAKNPAVDDSQLSEIQTTLMYMDASAMEGATIDIDYELKVTNDGEDDKLINYVYTDKVDAGKKTDTEIIKELRTFLNDNYKFNIPEDTLSSSLPVRANSIYDYVNINLEYRPDDNKDANGKELWTKVYDEDDRNSPYEGYHREWLTEDVVKRLDKATERKVAKVIKTSEYAENMDTNKDSNKGNMVATQSVVIPVHLGITLSENTGAKADYEMVYQNCAEIVQIHSASGRRDYDTIPGNYVPYDPSTEDDSQLTGTTTIVPPTGQNRIYYVIILLSATIIIVGIVAIKKKVLNK